jgi:hypothetical protein
MRYGGVFLRCGDIFAALQTVQSILDVDGPCAVQAYSYYELCSPERTGDDEYSVRIPSAGGYYVEVRIQEVDTGVFQVDVLGADLGSRGDQDRLARCILAQLKKRSDQQGRLRITVS